MLTVVIADREFLTAMKEYALFLEPFMKKNEAVFLEWRTKENTLNESVPGLFEAVARHDRWRAIVITDEESSDLQNPFNLIPYKEAVQGEAEDLESFFNRKIRLRKEAMDQAAKKPFTRLMTRLCEDPSITRKAPMNYKRKELTMQELGVATRETSREELEFMEYREISRYRQELRDEIRGDEIVRIELPSEVLCVAKRIRESDVHDLEDQWTRHMEHDYSRFYDWNLYYDKMRYLIFDMDDRDKLRYTYDYIRFAYSLLLLSSQDTPAGSLAPNRVYRMDCDIEERKLKEYLSIYDAKLTATKQVIQSQISSIRAVPEERLTDEEAERIFCANISVPVTLSSEFDRDGLYYLEPLGLTKDSPIDEEANWNDTYVRSRKRMQKLLKQPRRSLKKATGDIHRLNVFEEERASLLNEFQVEDVQSHTDNEELAMVDTMTTSLYETDYYLNKMEKSEQEVQKVLARRITTKQVWITLGVLVLSCVLAIVPLIFGNWAGAKTKIYALVIGGITFGILLLLAIILLLILRHEMKATVQNYNHTVNDIVDEVEENLRSYSRYLSHACNVMRGNSVVEYSRTHKDLKSMKVAVLEKHIYDIEEQRAISQEIFGDFFSDHIVSDPGQVEPYDYDFSRAVDYVYPLPVSESQKTQIEFLQKDNYTEIPLSFVKCITLRREELYD